MHTGLSEEVLEVPKRFVYVFRYNKIIYQMFFYKKVIFCCVWICFLLLCNKAKLELHFV